MPTFWFCEAKQYDPETSRGFGGIREIVEASYLEAARKKFQNIREDLQKQKASARLMLETYGFYGPFKSRQMAENIKKRYIRKKKRHSW